MSQPKPTYEELEQRCHAAEAMLEAIRSGQADTIIGEQGMLVLRLAETEEALRLNRERLSLALEAAQAGTWEWDLKTNENVWSEELWPVYGLEPHSCQPSYEVWLQTIHPDDRAAAAQIVQTAAAKGSELNAEWRVCDQNGTVRWLMSRGKPVLDAQGEVTRYIGIVLDITGRKRVEEALRQSEECFAKAFRASPYGLIISRMADGQIIEVNPSWQEISGYSPAEAVGQSSLALNLFVNPADRFQFVAQLQAEGSVRDFELEIRPKSGQVRQASLSAEMIELSRAPCILTIVQDITERKRTEEALRQSENTARAWLNAIQESAFMMDRDGTILAANATVARRLHRSVEEMVGASIYDFIPPQNADERRLHVAQVIESGQPVRFEDIRAGRIIDNLIYPVFDQAGQIKHLAILGADITERRQAEASLRQSEARYRLLAENMADVIWVLNTKSRRFTYVSPSVERLRGYSVAEVLTQPMEQVMTPDSLARINAGFPERLQAFLGGDPAAMTQTHEVEQLHKNGSTVWTEVVTTLLRNEAGEIEVLGVSRDISARKEAEKASRLKDDLLRLTGEMAHVGGWEFDATTLEGTWTDEVARIHDLDPAQPTNVELGVSFYRAESRQKIEQAIKEALELARPYDLELEMVSAKGRHKWVRTMGLPITEGSRVVKVRGIFQDITERKRAEDELRESRLRLELALKGANAGLWDWYVQTGRTVFNQRWAEIVGYTLEELEPVNIETWINLCHPDDLARSDELLKQHFAGRTDFYECEARMRHKNGEWVWVLDRGQVVEWDDAGNPIRMAGTHVDITERKQTEAKLQASTERFNAFFLNAPLQAVIYRFIRNPQGEIIDWEISDINPLGAASLGQAAEALLGRRAFDLFGPEVFTPYLELSRQVAATGQPRLFETHFETNGQDYLSSVFMVGADHYANVSVDITARKQAERERHIALEKYRVLFETFPLGISVTDAAGNLIEINRESERLLGISRQDHLRRTFDGPEWRIVRPDGTPMPPDEYASVQALQENRLVENVEMGVVKNDSEITWINVTAAPIPLESHGVVIAYGDITQRKRTEEALRESEERYRKLLELAPVAITVHCEGKIVFINPAGVRLMGAASEEEAIGRSVLDIIHPAGLKQAQERLRRMMAGEQGLYPVEDIYLKLDGTPINVEVMGTPLFYQGKPAVQTIVTDITERKRAEAEIKSARAFLEMVIDMSPFAMWISDKEGTVMRVNRSLCELINLTEAKIVGKYNVLKDANLDIQGVMPRVQVVFEKHQSVRFSIPWRAAEVGSVDFTGARDMYIDVSMFPILNGQGELTNVVCQWVDITERKRAEESLRESEARYRLIANNTDDVIWLLSLASGKFTYVSPSVQKLRGYTPEEILTQTMADALTPESLAEVAESMPGRIKQFYAGDSTAQVRITEVDQPRKDGSIVQTEVVTTLLTNAQGQVTEILGVTRDITKRKQAEEALRENEAFIKAVLDNLPVGVAVNSVDPTVTFNYMNDNFPRFYRTTKEKLADPDGFWEAIYEEPKFREEMRQKVLADCASGDEERMMWVDVPITRQGADTHFIAAKNIPVPGKPLMISTVWDVTERKRAEDELNRLNAELEQRVAERTVQLEVTNKELEAFAYSVSHDLRAPLRGIDGWSLALLEDYGEELDETASQYLDRVRSEAQRMGRLIDDLLQLSRITRAEMHRSPVDLSTLAQTVITRLREIEPERRVEVVIQPGLIASGDTALLEIVLTNLLGNAFKFSSHHTEARIEFGCLPSPSGRGVGGEGLVYFVRDNGAGFDMTYASKLFGAFQRLHKITEFPGTGIGLAIVQRIVHRHGGRAWAEAEIGQGATFYFTLEADPEGLRDL